MFPHAADASVIDQFVEDNFLRLRFQSIHQSRPLHGITGFQALRHAAAFHQFGHQLLQPSIRRFVDLPQMRIQLLRQLVRWKKHDAKSFDSASCFLCCLLPTLSDRCRKILLFRITVLSAQRFAALLFIFGGADAYSFGFK